MLAVFPFAFIVAVAVASPTYFIDKAVYCCCYFLFSFSLKHLSCVLTFAVADSLGQDYSLSLVKS